jgi:hypothetical protein
MLTRASMVSLPGQRIQTSRWQQPNFYNALQVASLPDGSSRTLRSVAREGEQLGKRQLGGLQLGSTPHSTPHAALFLLSASNLARSFRKRTVQGFSGCVNRSAFPALLRRFCYAVHRLNGPWMNSTDLALHRACIHSFRLCRPVISA